MINNLISYSYDKVLNNNIKDDLYFVYSKIYYSLNQIITFSNYEDSYNLLNAEDKVLMRLS